MSKKINLVLALALTCVLLISCLPMTSFANEALYDTYGIFDLDLEAIDNYIMLRLYDREAFNLFVNYQLMPMQRVQSVYSNMKKSLTGKENEDEVYALFEKYTYKEVIDSINQGAPIAELISSVPETLKSLGMDVDAYKAMSNKEAALSALNGKTFADMNDLADSLIALFGGVEIENTAFGFSDVSGKKLIEAVTYLTEKGIISGKSSTKFCPDDNVKREEFSKMLVLALGLYDENAKSDFEDVQQSDWYYTYVSSAVKENLIEGYGKTFGSGDYITREDVATIIHRAMDGETVNGGDDADSYADEAEISDYALAAVKTLTSAGMMSGVDGNRFAPKEYTTRAQVAEIIYCLITAE